MTFAFKNVRGNRGLDINPPTKLAVSFLEFTTLYVNLSLQEGTYSNP
jgi:hypothetical protein